MPTYTFKRPSDGAIAKQRLSFDEYERLRKGELRLADDQGETLELVFDPGRTTFSLKDGPSGGWASKAMKENKYRSNRRKVMTKREKDHVFKTRLIPNYMGAEAPTWRDAQEEARRDKGDLAAVTYEPHVVKESNLR